MERNTEIYGIELICCEKYSDELISAESNVEKRETSERGALSLRRPFVGISISLTLVKLIILIWFFEC